MLTLHEQAARVVLKIVEPSLELSLAQEELVVVAGSEEEAVVAVGVLAGGRQSCWLL